jgi:hypothetical protein
MLAKFFEPLCLCGERSAWANHKDTKQSFNANAKEMYKVAVSG